MTDRRGVALPLAALVAFVLGSTSSGCATERPHRPAATRYAAPTFAAVEGRIDVCVSGVDAARGHVIVALYDRGTWLRDDAVLAREVIPASVEETTVRLAHVPPGTYAIAVIADANDNGKMDLGLFGPEERYAFSRGARGIFGPPSFDDAAFAFDGSALTVRVRVR